MKSAGEIMEILEAYDETKSFRAASELANCSHHTVKRLVEQRAAGQPVPEYTARPKITDDHLGTIERIVEETRGKIRADVLHQRLLGMGYTGSERSTRREVSNAKKAWRAGHQRVHRPWETEPGKWLQFDYGDGPVIDGVKTVLFIAWLAWCRYRVVIPLRDRKMPSVQAALDRCFRLIGGVPDYVLTDNEKTVTTMHVAGVPVRNRQIVTFSRYYGTQIHTCQPADPASKGGVENAVKIAKADLLPTATNLRPAYRDFTELEAACDEFMAVVNAKEHRATRRRPAAMLAEEQERLHPIPAKAFTVVFGSSRKVPAKSPMVTFENAQYSVPYPLMGQEVWVRNEGAGHDTKVVIVHVGPDGPVEVARHPKRDAGVVVNGSHYPHREEYVPGFKKPRAKTPTEAQFLAIGDGAASWLQEAGRQRRGANPGEDGAGRATCQTARQCRGGSRPGARGGQQPLRPRGPALHFGIWDATYRSVPGARAAVVDPGHQ